MQLDFAKVMLSWLCVFNVIARIEKNPAHSPMGYNCVFLFFFQKPTSVFFSLFKCFSSVNKSSKSKYRILYKNFLHSNIYPFLNEKKLSDPCKTVLETKRGHCLKKGWSLALFKIFCRTFTQRALFPHNSFSVVT